ncbi:MAG: RidA family protein [Anaerolineae bacterium]|jgi:reactive intermediate/imine deaminase|nr:RidA family protein [Anaerolineae bacterium]MBT7601616.1 RidA family protein [Anaerolineae bacterium]MBT7990977.1 RidA family protein [Anaerolineae bacterium]
MSVKLSNPKGVPMPGGQYSQAAQVSFNTDLLFISGQGPQNMAGETVGIGNMTAQAEQVFKNLQAILEAHNSSFAKAIKATIYITDMSLLAEFNAIRAKYYGAAKPASALVEVSALVGPDWMLEVEMIALA